MVGRVGHAARAVTGEEVEMKTKTEMEKSRLGLGLGVDGIRLGQTHLDGFLGPSAFTPRNFADTGPSFPVGVCLSLRRAPRFVGPL